MSKRYTPPPPPYERSLRQGQKVTEDQTLEPPKGPSPFEDERWHDSKHSRGLSNNPSRDTSPVIPKPTVSLEGLRPRVARPLPRSPADARPLGPRGLQGGRSRPINESKTDVALDNYEAEPLSPGPPPFSATEHTPLYESPYLQSMDHTGPSGHPSSVCYSSQPPCNAPRRHHDHRWSALPYPYASSPSRSSSSIPLQSSSYLLPQNNNLGTRLRFDPSVAYSGTWTDSSTPRRAAAALYSSAVSSHLLNSETIPGSLPYHLPARTMHRRAETSRTTNTDVPFVRSSIVSSASSTPSLYTIRPRSSDGYEQRWASSEADITRDVYLEG